MLNTFKEFLDDERAWEMFITGQAGTGKTTSLADLVKHCIEIGIPFIVCAHTHKACNVLRSKLPVNTNVTTLWSFLRKRPGINDSATSIKNLQSTYKCGDSDEDVKLVFVDEFSMVGEDDLMDLRSLQDAEYEGEPNIKVVAIGDMNQLPPVGDAQTWVPKDPYWVKLTKIYRQAGDNELTGTLATLVDMIEGGPVKALESNKNFTKDLTESELLSKKDKDSVFLCYTNERVQYWNRLIAGKELPEPGDMLFSPSAHRYYEFVEVVQPQDIEYVDRLRDDQLFFGSKYKTLEFLLSSGLCDFYKVIDLEYPDTELIFPVCWGTYQNKIQRNELSINATKVNKQIESKHKINPAVWAKKNYTDPLARQRAKAWRCLLTFNDCILAMDFAHAMTVHKSQGSTFKNVCLDAQDLYICANKDFRLYLRLYYVALSRASFNVYTN